MDFQLTPEQVEIRDATRKLCTGRFPIAALRGQEGGGLDGAMWAELADSGVFALRQPEQRGGAGLGMAEAAVVFEELGRGLVPGPLAWSHLAAGLPGDAEPVDAVLGGDGVVDGAVVGGDAVVGGVERRVGGDAVVGGVERGVGDGRGPLLIEHLDSLDNLVVLDGDGVWLVDPAELAGRPAVPLDPLTPVAVVGSLPRGSQVGPPPMAERWRLEGATLVAAQLAGMASALVDLTVAYTQERRQFGRPIGSFQALKHLMADMVVRAELARTQAYAAAVHLDDPDLGGTLRAVSAAKVVAGRAAVANASASVQAHGGMGYTWEVDAHLYLKRAWALDPLFGSADDHADAMAGLLR